MRYFPSSRCLFFFLMCFCFSLNVLPVAGQVTQVSLDQRLEWLESEQPMSDEEITKELRFLLDQYEQLPFSENKVKTMAWYSFQVHQQTPTVADSLARQAIAIASVSLKDSLAASTFFAHLALGALTDFESAVKHLEDALQICETYDYNYFLVRQYQLTTAKNAYDEKMMQQLHDEMGRVFTGPDSAKVVPFSMLFYEAKMTLAMFKGNAEQLMVYAQKTLQLDGEYKFYNPQYRLKITSELAYAHARIGQYEEAEKVVAAAIAQNENHPELLCDAYVALGRIYDVQGLNAKSAEASKRAVEVGEASGVGDLASASFNLATSQFLIGQLAEARKTIEKVKRYFPVSTYFAVHNLEARIYTVEGDYAAAIQAAQAGLINISTTFTDTSTAINPTIIDEFRDLDWAVHLLYRKATAQRKLGVEQKEVSYLQAAQATNQLMLALATDGFSNLQGFELTQYFGILNQFIRLGLHLETKIALDFYQVTNDPSYLDAAFVAFERQKAQALLKTLAPPQLPEQEQARIEKARKTLVNAQRTAALQSDAAAQAKVIETSELLEELVQELRDRYPVQTNHYYAIPYVNASELQNHLPAGTAVVSYNVFQDAPYAFVVGANTKKVIPLAIEAPGTDIIAKINEYVQRLRSPLIQQRAQQEQLKTLSLELYEDLVAPLQAHLQYFSHLVIIGQGELFNLPFETLLTSEVEDAKLGDWPYLIRDYEISYHYSASAYVLMKEKEAITDQSLLAFAPVFTTEQKENKSLESFEFSLDTLNRSIGDGQFLPLPATREEVNTIAELLPDGSRKKVLLDSIALKSALLAELNNNSYQYLHIATHGLANMAEARRSALACYTDEATQDALLFLDEIQLANVNADLVVLSSCDSGLGQLVKGEGMLALNRAFLFAGARNVVSSLWKVSDAKTKIFMVYFYQALQNGASYSTALRSAKLRMLENTATSLPRFWSAFMLIGE